MGTREDVARSAFTNGAKVAGVEDGFASQESSVEITVNSKQQQVNMVRRPFEKCLGQCFSNCPRTSRESQDKF